METTSANKIVMVIETNEELGSHKIFLTTFENAEINKRYKEYGRGFDYFPYKWYDLRKFYQVPAYWILLKLHRNDRTKISKQQHKAMSTIVSITEILAIIKSVIEVLGAAI